MQQARCVVGLPLARISANEQAESSSRVPVLERRNDENNRLRMSPVGADGCNRSNPAATLWSLFEGGAIMSRVCSLSACCLTSRSWKEAGSGTGAGGDWRAGRSGT